MFSLICARINGWVNNREAGDLRCHRSHCDVTLMRPFQTHFAHSHQSDCISMIKPMETNICKAVIDTCSRCIKYMNMVTNIYWKCIKLCEHPFEHANICHMRLIRTNLSKFVYCNIQFHLRNCWEAREFRKKWKLYKWFCEPIYSFAYCLIVEWINVMSWQILNGIWYVG